MIRIPLQITYADGRTAAVDATQYAVAEYGQHCLAAGIVPPPIDGARSVADMMQIRYMAWAELARHDRRMPGFDAWNRTVDEVSSAREPVPVDPTGPAIPAASSP